MRHRILQLDRDHVRILLAFVSVSGLLALAKLVGAAKEVVVAAKYGTGASIDAYTFLFSIVSWPVAVWASVLATLLVPILVRASHHDPENALAFRRELLGFSILSGIAIALVLGAILAVGIDRSILGMSPTVAALAATMLAPMLLVVPLGFVAGQVGAEIMAGQSKLNSLLDGAPALVILLAVVIFSPATPMPLVWGAAAGYFAQIGLSVAVHPLGRTGFRPVFSMKSPLWPAFLGGFGIVAAGQLIGAGASIVDQLMLVRLGVGANASFGYADRVLALLVGLGAMAVGRATLPIFSGFSDQDSDRQRKIVVQWSRILFLSGLLLSVVAWFVAPEAIRLLYLRGAFSESDALMVTEVFRYGLTQLPFYFAGMVFVQLIASKGRFMFFIYIGLFQLIVKAVANVILIDAFGVPGVALSAGVRAALSLLFIWLYSRSLAR